MSGADGQGAGHGSVLAAEGLSFAIGGVDIVTDVDLAVADGELLGVIGPNGAGKTTLFNLFSGIAAPTSGTIRFRGTDITGWSVERRARAGLGRTFQTSSVFPALSVEENVRIAAQARLGDNLALWRRASSSRAAVTSAREQLDLVGLSSLAGRPAGLLSHGDKRKLEIAILLAGESRLLLLDEPMAGVSAEDVDGLTGLISSVHRERRTTVIMVEHHVEVVLDLADRIAVMHHGALLACDEPETVMADSTVQTAYLGEPL
jgi:branched-chain amino acid transport system ATP-binding protein